LLAGALASRGQERMVRKTLGAVAQAPFALSLSKCPQGLRQAQPERMVCEGSGSRTDGLRRLGVKNGWFARRWAPSPKHRSH
jgi:hypothetical protein